jgi:hypothetical protein
MIIKRTRTNRVLKQMITAWNQYPRGYKMFMRSRDYRALASTWNHNERLVAEWVLSVRSAESARPDRIIRAKRDVLQKDIDFMLQSNEDAKIGEQYTQKTRKKLGN